MINGYYVLNFGLETSADELMLLVNDDLRVDAVEVRNMIKSWAENPKPVLLQFYINNTSIGSKSYASKFVAIDYHDENDDSPYVLLHFATTYDGIGIEETNSKAQNSFQLRYDIVPDELELSAGSLSIVF